MTLDQMLRLARATRDAARDEDNRNHEVLVQMRAALDGDNPPTAAEVEAAVSARDGSAARLAEAEARVREVEAEKARDDAATELAERVGGTSSTTAVPVGGPAARDASPGMYVRTHDGRPAAVARGQRFADHPVVREHMDRVSSRDAAVVGQHGSLGQMVRAMTTTSGSALVPQVWASDIIDRARNASAVIRAGAQVVPMDAKTVNIGRLTTDPTAAFRTEGSLITPSDPVFDSVVLDAKTQSCLVVGSLEWFQDADNVDQIVADAIGQAIGGNLDLQALYGGVTTGSGAGINYATPPNPRGILASLLANASSSVLGFATDGTTQTAASFWNEIVDTVLTPADYNELTTGLIWNSKAERMYAKAYDSTYQPLRAPEVVARVPRFVSNQIPSFTRGAMTNVATDVFAGDFTKCLIGQRLDLTVQTLTERYAENGQVGIVAHWRGDVGLARPRAFAVYRSIKGAA